jgi:Tol biopolymer transport system component
VACSENTAPVRSQLSPGITFLAGNDQTDTIQAPLGQSLEVQAADLQGRPISRAQVVFNAVVNAQVEPLDASSPSTSASATTDENGRAAVIVVLGSRAGSARITASLPTVSLTDTATFVVTPGKAASLAIAPLDTTIYNGTRAQLRTSIADRLGNPRTDAVHLVVASGPATVSGDTVVATDFGVATIAASAGGLTASPVRIASVPHGTLAAGNWGSQIVIFNLDGSGLQQITIPSTISPHQAGAIKWGPSGTQLVFDQTRLDNCVDGSGEILTLNRDGTTRAVDSSGADGQAYADQWPQYSRDGSWIYYSKTSLNSPLSAIWRVQPNGANDDSLPNQMPDLDQAPTPSPNDQQVAYVAVHAISTDLRVLTVATGAVTSLGINAWSPQWSPVSDQIAYLTFAACSGPIGLVHADGSGAHVLTSTAHVMNFDWSPDGTWLAATNAVSGHIDLINVNSGVTVPLTFTTGLVSPAWQK